MGFTETLTIVFIVLKLLGKIDWSWWLVLLPELIGAAFYIGILIWDIYDRVSFNRQIRKWRK